MWASESGHSSTVRELLDGGASVNIQDNVRMTVRPTIVIFGITSSLHHTQLLATSLLI